MNVFVLNTGRCGSTTFIKACGHITNYTCAHESRAHLLGKERLDYPDNHIEADNRLSWVLGRLDMRYGADAIYVHLFRDVRLTAASFIKRFGHGIIHAYRTAIVLHLPEESEPMDVALDYCDTVNSNICLFLKDKPRTMSFDIEHSKNDFVHFLEIIGAQGDLNAALLEFDRSYNMTVEGVRRNAFRRALRKLERIIRKMPSFLRSA